MERRTVLFVLLAVVVLAVAFGPATATAHHKDGHQRGCEDNPGNGCGNGPGSTSGVQDDEDDDEDEDDEDGGDDDDEDNEDDEDDEEREHDTEDEDDEDGEDDGADEDDGENESEDESGDGEDGSVDDDDADARTAAGEGSEASPDDGAPENRDNAIDAPGTENGEQSARGGPETATAEPDIASTPTETADAPPSPTAFDPVTSPTAAEGDPASEAVTDSPEFDEAEPDGAPAQPTTRTVATGRTRTPSPRATESPVTSAAPPPEPTTVTRDVPTTDESNGRVAVSGAELRVRTAALDATWVREGQETAVLVSVANPTDRRLRDALTVTVDGTRVANRSVALAPGERTEVAIEFPAREGVVVVAGTSVGVLNVSTRLRGENVRTVEVTDTTGPGFGPLIPFVAFGLLVWLVRGWPRLRN
jgi:hypothetical protein